MTEPPRIFDPTRRRLARSRRAHQFADHDFLHQRAMEDVVDRLETVTRDFPQALFVGAGPLTAMLTNKCGVGAVTHMDEAPGRLPADGCRLCADEERLPFAPESFDLVVSLLTLHNANDVLGALIQARQALKPDGLYIGAAFADGTLGNWRAALREAEIAETGSLSARAAPLAAVQDFGHALSRAGFAMPVTDIDPVRVSYADPMRLIADLRGIGETATLGERPAPLRRNIIASALARFAENGGKDIFNIVFMTGWAPAPTQPKPLKPGAATASLEQAVKSAEDVIKDR